MPASNVLDADVVKGMRDARAAGKSYREIADEFDVSISSVHKKTHDIVVPPKPVSAGLPEPAPEASGLRLPDAITRPMGHVAATEPGWYVVLGDTHFPMHDKGTIEAAVREGRDKGAVGFLLNGDGMDMFSTSPFYREPSKEGFAEEIECGRAAFTWMRAMLPKARFIYREGNHEFRLKRYIVERAAALWDLPELRLPNLLGLPNLGIEWVENKAKVNLGRLITLHGHELRKGEGVNPARLAFLRTTCTVLVSHHHRTSEHHQRGLDDKPFAAWSVGCACSTHPDYDPYNQWNHGYAMVHVESDGWFSVHNRRVVNGRVV